MEQMKQTEQTRKWQLFNGTTLKLLAAFLMLLDHVHQMYAWRGAPMWLTMLGRPVFPLFLFMAAEGFHYTRNRKAYLKRLLFASWGMTILTFVIQRAVPNPNIVLMNNAFSTFFVAVLYMQVWERLCEGIKGKSFKIVLKALGLALVPVLCAAPMFVLAVLSSTIPVQMIRPLAMLTLLLPNILTVEGGAAMVLLGLLFYIFRKYRLLQIAALLALSALVYVSDGGVQWMMCFAAIPMLLYNGEKGRGMKNFFYIFYPAHICILYLISTWF